MTRTVLITGAGSGFGKAAAIELAGRGHDVIATTETRAQADALAAETSDLRATKLDVTDAADVAGAADFDVDVLINNAGVGVLGPMANVPLEKVRLSFEVNVLAPSLRRLAGKVLVDPLVLLAFAVVPG